MTSKVRISQLLQAGIGAVVATLMLAAPVAAQLTGTSHDFSGTWSVEGEMCNVCHTPHNAQVLPDAPLWNHANTTTVFTLYTSSTLDSVPAQPAGSSMMCLSCHDGTVNVNAYGSAPGTLTIGAVNGNLGTDLGTSHPISIDYTTLLSTTDGELFDPATALSGLGGTIAADMLFTDALQCASCHDVHGTANSYFLHIDNAGSALCLTCHDKG